MAGVPCRAIAVGFVGELSYELHHPRGSSVALWDALLEAGRAWDIRPHGLDALDVLRLEKGHIFLAQDTMPDDHPTKLGLDWAVAPDKPSFVGKQALDRMASLPLDRKLVGLRFDGTPQRGAPLAVEGTIVGRVTSCAVSEAVGAPIGLGWIRTVDDVFPADARGHRHHRDGRPDTVLRPGGGAAAWLSFGIARWPSCCAARTPPRSMRSSRPGMVRACCAPPPTRRLFVADPAVAADVAREVEDRIAALDDDALVLDVSDGWAAWSLAGDDARRALSYLSHLDPPGDGGVRAGRRRSRGREGPGRAGRPDDPRPGLLARARARARDRGCAGDHVTGLFRHRTFLERHELRPAYDVVIIGGGVNGLSLAHNLASRHGIDNVAVLDANYIGSGGSGRNTQVVRANYNTPETVPLYKASLGIWRTLSQELDFNLLFSTQGELDLCHTWDSLEVERDKSLLNRAYGVQTDVVTPGRDRQDEPAGRSDRRRGVPDRRGVVSPAGLDRATRLRGVGVRRQRHAPRGAHPRADRGHRDRRRRRRRAAGCGPTAARSRRGSS